MKGPMTLGNHILHFLKMFILVLICGFGLVFFTAIFLVTEFINRIIVTVERVMENQRKGGKSNIKRAINTLNLIMSIIVFSTGWILFTQFHIGDGAFRQEWMGIGKVVWMAIHQLSAIGFFIGLTLHIRVHWQYIKTTAKRWGKKNSKKIKSRIRWQILLSVGTIVVVWAGFYPWVVMPEATLEIEVYHGWIDVHNRVAIFYTIGLAVHIIKRWRSIGITYKTA